MQFSCLTGLAALLSVALAGDLKIDVLKSVPESECKAKSKNGDHITVHYLGTFENGEVFDSSYKRNQPFPIVLGAGLVIKGWDQGLTDMCVGEKRRLTIPPELAYGKNGAGGVIPPDATLIFEVEMTKIEAGKDEL